MITTSLPRSLALVLLLFGSLPGSLLTAQGALFRSPGAIPHALGAMDLRERKLVPWIRRTAYVRVRPADIVANLHSPTRPRQLRLTMLGKDYVVRIGHVESSLGHYRLDGWAGKSRFALAMNGTSLSAQLDGDDEIITVRATGIQDIHVIHVHAARHIEADCGHTGTAETAPPKTAPSHVPLALTDVDVMVFYTPLARDNTGGRSSMDAEVHLRIALANVANSDSGVSWRWRLVFSSVTTYTEPNPVKLVPILNRFIGKTDGYMDEVHALRTYYGADVMALICDGLKRDWGGYARCRSSVNSAFSITHRAALPAHILHHEMGHNLGLAHNRANVDCSGSYSYSYGWRTKDNKFHTVMSYAGGKPPSKRVNLWSGPSIRHATYTMGTATDDNARTLSNRGPIVSRFLPTNTLEWFTLHGGISGSHALPQLVATGTTHPKARPQIQFSGFAQIRHGVLLVGGSRVNLPLLGGMLLPSPDIAVPLSSGQTFDAAFLNSIAPGTWVWFQGFFVDPTAVQGWSATHGVKVQTL